MTSDSFSPPVILLVEDSLTQAVQARFLLESNGFAVEHARNGVEALVYLHQSVPFAILSDINMPELDGYELCRQVRTLPAVRHLPVLLLTSLSDPADVRAALECGADYFFTKPIDEPLLLGRLRQLAAAPPAEGDGAGAPDASGQPPRMLNLLLSTYEAAVAKNAELRKTQADLRELNDKLEERVRERTLALESSNTHLQQEIVAREDGEARLREQAELLNRANEAIITLNRELQIQFWNRGAERMLKWTAAEVQGRSWRGILGLDGTGSAGDDFRQAIVALRDWRGEITVRNKEGQSLVLETSITGLRDAAGRFTGWLSISSDITQKKALEERFLRTQRLESLGTLAAGISHDLNNVLAPIGMASALLRGRFTQPADLKIVDILARSVDRGSALVKQILGFAHGVGGEHRPVQLKHVLRDITAVISRTFPKSITLEEHVAADLWPLHGNPSQIHQIVLNLCVNARDAMPSGGFLRINVANCTFAVQGGDGPAEVPAGNWVRLEVSDTGVGMTPEVLARIWEPFFTTKGKDQGTGLGLATVRGIVDTHKGFITVKTALGKGTTFTVFLPPSSEAFTDPTAAEETPDAVGRGERILVVDDEESIASVVREMLELFQYQVETAANGLEAEQMFNRQPGRYALVVTDLDMPGKNGVDLLSALRARRADIKVLAISGLSPQERRKLGGKMSDFDFHLDKPFGAAQFVRLVQEILPKPASTDEAT